MSSGGTIRDPGGRATARLRDAIARGRGQPQSASAMKRTLATMELDELIYRETNGRRTQTIGVTPAGLRMAVDRGIVNPIQVDEDIGPLPPRPDINDPSDWETSDQVRQQMIAVGQRMAAWAVAADVSDLTPWDVVLRAEAAAFGPIEANPSVEELGIAAAQAKGVVEEVHRQWIEDGKVAVELIDTLLQLNNQIRRVLFAVRSSQEHLRDGDGDARGATVDQAST